MSTPSATATADRTACPGSTAASAAVRTSARTGLTRCRFDGFPGRQVAADVPVARQQPYEVAFHHVRGDQTVAADAQSTRNARAFADHGNARLQVARLAPIGWRVIPVAQAHVRA